MLTELTIRSASLDEIRPLRHLVLRAGLPFSEATFEKDDEPTTHHVGAFLGTGETVGCATIVRNPWNSGESWDPAWRLRGMAVRGDLRSHGIGQRLLSAIDEFVLRAPFDPLLWCNARVPAIPFYQRLGWIRVGEEFDVPTAGPHFKMFKKL